MLYHWWVTTPLYGMNIKYSFIKNSCLTCLVIFPDFSIEHMRISFRGWIYLSDFWFSNCWNGRNDEPSPYIYYWGIAQLSSSSLFLIMISHNRLMEYVIFYLARIQQSITVQIYRTIQYLAVLDYWMFVFNQYNFKRKCWLSSIIIAGIRIIYTLYEN